MVGGERRGVEAGIEIEIVELVDMIVLDEEGVVVERSSAVELVRIWMVVVVLLSDLETESMVLEAVEELIGRTLRVSRCGIVDGVDGWW